MKTVSITFFVSSIEFEKVYMVMDKRLALGYSDLELSFLLGYRALYVRDVEDPMHTLRYTPKDTNYLLGIFECGLSEIMPAKLDEMFYQIMITVKVDKAGARTFEISRELKNKDYTHYRTITEKESHTEPSKSVADADQVQNYLEYLFNSNYFDEAKTSLEIFKKCIKRFGWSLRPQHIMKAVSFYTAKRKAPRLIQLKNESARTVYAKEM